MEERRRIGAYGVLWGSDGRVLLVRGASGCPFPGVWRVPGGGVRHGEHPVAAVVREFAEQTGLTVEVTGVRDAVADVTTYRDPDVAVHTDRLVFDVEARGADLRPEPAGGNDELGWFTPREAAGMPLMPFTAELLGLPVTPLPGDLSRALPAGGLAVGAAGGGDPGRGQVAAATADRRQRFAAYGLVTDPDDRVLLTRIAPGYPGAGKWHLPGGGTDHGEQPAAGLLRELVEESGQLGTVVGLLTVSNLHHPAALGPEGRPMDWHSVRVVYRVRVEAPTEAVVTELAGGSTAEAAWFTNAQVAGLRMTEVAALATGRSGR
ncbi:NUDIX domain-containing protein [Micromonospora coxensis]|uniref:ADP-ribose pyrophosphatase YjhB, NUDIX family n=1 Tax=Micromonospora coxensis TaxID=356852 RepID=A0A1C5I8W1_9ACTN|nr:NUDIX domain-containing protein [Micromonospora coxensis]SCG54714.1 ADP-ribose pyrophosphatase YjhB, NUDIX family [Micromonospora coxensis]